MKSLTTKLLMTGLAAMKAKDATKLGAILADNWLGLEYDGKILDKAKLWPI